MVAFTFRETGTIPTPALLHAEAEFREAYCAIANRQSVEAVTFRCHLEEALGAVRAELQARGIQPRSATECVDSTDMVHPAHVLRADLNKLAREVRQALHHSKQVSTTPAAQSSNDMQRDILHFEARLHGLMNQISDVMRALHRIEWRCERLRASRRPVAFPIRQNCVPKSSF